MFMILGECKKNYRQATNTLNVILIVKENRIWHLNLSEHFIAYDTVKEKKRRKTATDDGNALNILATVQSNSTICTRQLEREYELRRLILRILLKTNFIRITFTCMKI